MVGTLQGAIDFSIAIALNDRYRYGFTNRCNPLQWPYQSDCSGLVCASWHSQGVALDVCTGSFAISRLCHQKGLGVPLNQAVPGDLLFIGANEGQGRLDGSADGVWPGHIARLCLGPKGIPRWVVESRNHRAGTTYAPAFYGRGWSYAAHDPFLSALTPAPPSPPPRKDDFMRVIPLKRDGAAGNAQPFLVFVPNGGPTSHGLMLSYHGARIHWDINEGDAPLGGDKDPRTIAIPGGAKNQVIYDVVPLGPISQPSVRICAYGTASGEWYGTAHV